MTNDELKNQVWDFVATSCIVVVQPLASSPPSWCKGETTVAMKHLKNAEASSRAIV